MLETMVNACGPEPSLADLRIMAACLLIFAAFLHYSMMRFLSYIVTMSHSTPTYRQLRICSSKTDQYRQGDNIVVARSGIATCAFSMLVKYMRHDGLSPHPFGALL